MDQHFSEGLGMLGGEPKPAANRLILVARDLLSRPQAATSHHHQKCAAHLLGRCAQPVHRRAVSLAEPGATTFAMVALAAFKCAVSHHVQCGAIGKGGLAFVAFILHLHTYLPRLTYLAKSPP